MPMTGLAGKEFKKTRKKRGGRYVTAFHTRPDGWNPVTHELTYGNSAKRVPGKMKEEKKQTAMKKALTLS